MAFFEDGHVQIAQPHGQSFDIFDENTLSATFKLPKHNLSRAGKTSRFINLGGVKRQVINDLSWAFSSGFLAGTNVAKYLEDLD